MQTPIHLRIQHQTLWLSAARVLFWEEAQIMIAADLHFGKSGHFRKSSIPIPQAVFKQDLHRLFDQIQYFQPKKVLIVGDMFHSSDNAEIEWFSQWRASCRQIPFLLIQGNHDILSTERYDRLGIELKKDQYSLNPFQFQHHPSTPIAPETIWQISGHVHPGVALVGMGKQKMKFPCFHVRKQQILLPAFSDFSGLHCMPIEKEDQIFAIVPGSNGVFNATIMQTK
jgi:uncharacterized protein